VFAKDANTVYGSFLLQYCWRGPAEGAQIFVYLLAFINTAFDFSKNMVSNPSSLIIGWIVKSAGFKTNEKKVPRFHLICHFYLGHI
jgi:hypothetical protein